MQQERSCLQSGREARLQLRRLRRVDESNLELAESGAPEHHAEASGTPSGATDWRTPRGGEGLRPSARQSISPEVRRGREAGPNEGGHVGQCGGIPCRLRCGDVVAGQAQRVARCGSIRELHESLNGGVVGGGPEKGRARADMFRQARSLAAAPPCRRQPPLDRPECRWLPRFLVLHGHGKDDRPHCRPLAPAYLPAGKNGARHEGEDHGGHCRHELTALRRPASDHCGGGGGFRHDHGSLQAPADAQRCHGHGEPHLQVFQPRGKVQSPRPAPGRNSREVGGLWSQGHAGP
mmetsp:Transcript_15012/g.34077  ORF Transcript_15012/g.34077 Transcript_15012/m.34077 type:complete len:292 (-) Transcript_15012:1864-2739(-)